jgi:ABC-type Fe3+ transport system permease subunit
VLEAWLPQFKFLGLGLGLLAIVMALGTIAKRLRNMGQVIFSQLPENMRPATPPPPKRVKLFQLSALMGIMVLLIVLIVGIVLAAGVVSDYWNHSIANELNPAQPGSELHSQLSVISSYFYWLNPLRMIGMASLFTAITVALTVIIGTLRMQTNLLKGLVQKAV